MQKHWHPGMLLATSSAYWQGCTLQAAVRLDLFTALGDTPQTATEVAERLATDPDATTLLLQALSGMDLLVIKGDRFANTAASGRFLVATSPDYLGHIIKHHHHLLDGWAQLEQAVRSGTKVSRRSYGEEAEREAFLLGMYNLAMATAPEVAATVDLTGRRRLLDLGGGPGTYACHFCQANPGLSAVVFDRPTTEPFARATAKRFGLESRIDFLAGDFVTDEINGGPYDVAWLSHVLHSNTEEQCQRLIAGVVRSLSPGGLLLVHDFILDNDKGGPEFPALFSLNMLLAGNGGRSYSEAEIGNMLEASSLQNIQRLGFRAKNDSAIICAEKAE